MQTGFSRTQATVYFFVLFLIVFIGRSPCEFAFPVDRLDPSWAWALSFFSQEHLAFGREVIYNFGPLADLYTKYYNPYHSGLFAVVNSGIVLLLTKMVFDLSVERLLKEKIAVCGLLGLCLWLCNSEIFPDVFYQIYCLVFVLWGFRAADRQARKKQPLELCTCALPLVLMVLMKGTFFFAATISIFVVAIWMLHRKAYSQVVILGLTLVTATLTVWGLCKQPVLGLTDYIVHMVRMSSAYLDGMSLTGAHLHIYAYLVFVALVPVFSFDKKRKLLSILFVCCSELFLFLGAKHGFGRHDGHAGLASAMVTSVLLAIFLFINSAGWKRFAVAAVVSAICVKIIGYGYPDNLLRYSVMPFKAAWTLAFDRQALNERYAATVQGIRGRYEVGAISGTVDVYNYNNSVALASTGIYTPRPIFQSYQAFDGYFAEENLKFLEKKAPDNILFRVETIDGRYPTLDDGISWPSIFSNYDLNSIHNGYLFLKKKNQLFQTKEMISIRTVQTGFGQSIAVPSDDIVFVKLRFKKTFLGRLATLIFKTTNVFIKIKTQDGQKHTYRLIPRMTETGFYLSPLIRGNEEILNLYADRPTPANAVTSLELQTDHPGWFWEKDVEVEFLTHKPFLLSEAFVANWKESHSVVELPMGMRARSTESMKGYVDSVTVGPVLKLQNQLEGLRLTSIVGWFFDKVMPSNAQRVIVLQQEGQRVILKVKDVQRQDVADYFHDTTVVNAGYSVSFNASGLLGNWQLFAGYLTNGELVTSATAMGSCHFW